MLLEHKSERKVEIQRRRLLLLFIWLEGFGLSAAQSTETTASISLGIKTSEKISS